MMQANARSVNVKTSELLAKLIANREKHAVEYKVAMEGYRIEVKNQLEHALSKLQADPKAFDDGVMLHEDPPEDHTSDYDLAITMMEMSTDETIHMDSASFNQYVMDNWSWKQSFTASTTKYISNVR